MLSRLVIMFLPRSKCLLISWLQSPSAVILEPQKIKSDTVSQSLLKFIAIESVMPSSHLILCHPLLLLLLIFCNESFFTSGHHKYWNFTISPYSEYSGNVGFV